METLLPRLQRSRARPRPERAEHPARAATPQGQQPFTLVAPLLRAALLVGAAGGFVLASVLSLSLALRLPLGAWWLAVAQAHGHLQVYGWAGLFVIGVAFHFLPRLRGAPLAYPRVVPWLLAALLAALVLRSVSQPLLVVAAGGGRDGGDGGAWAALWRALLVVSGLLEAGGIASVLAVLGGTALRRGAPAFRARPALWSVWPFLLCAVGSLGLAALLNLSNVFGAAGSGNGGIVPPGGDAANVLLGLFGFLVPMALAMSARALPMYAGLDAFPRRVLWPAALAYAAGLLLALLGELDTGGNLASGAALGRLGGLGLALMGGVLVAFIALFGRLMAGRGRLPQRVRSLAPAPEQAARGYVRHVTNERATFGPYVALIGSAYGWALLAGITMPSAAASERSPCTRNSRATMTMAIHAGTTATCTSAISAAETKTLSAVRSRKTPSRETRRYLRASRPSIVSVTEPATNSAVAAI